MVRFLPKANRRTPFSVPSFHFGDASIGGLTLKTIKAVLIFNDDDRPEMLPLASELLVSLPYDSPPGSLRLRHDKSRVKSSIFFFLSCRH